MIRIGFTESEKQKEVAGYVKDHGIKKVFCFYFKKFPVRYDVDCEIEYVEYADIEMYKYFYRLLEEIDGYTLLIMDGCMRTQNRSELIYNCAHHYLNQTPHKIIYELFPIIDSNNDFMILLDFENKGKYKGKSFDYSFLSDEDIVMKPYELEIELICVETTAKDFERYEKKRDSLFDSLGDKDPDTIPRNLQLLAGDIKKKAIQSNKLYIARNKRMKLDNVISYADDIEQGEYIVIDTHYRRLDMNDFLKKSGMHKIKYLSTELRIDEYVFGELVKWKARLDEIYAKASICK